MLREAEGETPTMIALWIVGGLMRDTNCLLRRERRRVRHLLPDVLLSSLQRRNVLGHHDATWGEVCTARKLAAPRPSER